MGFFSEMMSSSLYSTSSGVRKPLTFDCVVDDPRCRFLIEIGWLSRHQLSHLGLDEFVANGIANQRGRRAQLQFVVSGGPMGLDGLAAQTHDSCDLLVAVTFSNELHHRALAGAQRA